MNAEVSERNKLYLGLALFLALLIGGGTGTGLFTDTLIQVAVVLAAAPIFASPGAGRIPTPVLVLCALALLAPLLQLIPLPALLLTPFRPEVLRDPSGLSGATFQTISLGLNRTLETILYAATVVLFTLAVLKLRVDQVYRLLPFFLLGLACNALAALLQYSWQASVRLDGILPYTITAGIFANVNHFSTLMYVSIPLLVFLGRQKPLYAFLSVTAVLLLLLAAGSRAGVVFGLAVSLLSLMVLFAKSRLSLAVILAAGVIGSIYGIGAWTKLEFDDPRFGRAEMAATTVEGVKETWLLGVGYGNFERAYEIYEDPSLIFDKYVNHAHNDYLELVFEGGVLALVALLLYFVILVRQLRYVDSPFQKAALLAIAFILVHSLVDYPLRTLALALTFGYLNAIVFHPGFRLGGQADALLEVEHGGQRLFVPVGAAMTGLQARFRPAEKKRRRRHRRTTTMHAKPR